MDTCFVTMLTNVGDKNVGEKYEVDKETAAKWVTAGLCEVVENPTDKAIDQFSKALEDRDNKIVEELSKSLRNVTVKVPSNVNAISGDEDPESNFFVLVGKTASKDARVREKAYNTLANKYGQKTNMSEGTTTAGGFMVPTLWAKELLQLDGYEGVAFPSRVNVVPMQSKVINYPALDQTVTPSNGSSAFYGGISIGFVAEGNAPAANTQPAFRQVVLTAKKALATAQVTQELLDDSPISVEKILNDGFRRAAGAFIDYNIFNGAGGSTAFTGLVNHASTIKVHRASAGKVNLVDLANMWAKLTPQSRKRAVWVINPAVWGQIPVAGTGTNTNLVMMPNGGQGAFDMRFLGLPILDSEALPTLGNAADVMLVDL
jgi:HK97 family phage major capsid protein